MVSFSVSNRLRHRIPSIAAISAIVWIAGCRNLPPPILQSTTTVEAALADRTGSSDAAADGQDDEFDRELPEEPESRIRQVAHSDSEPGATSQPRIAWIRRLRWPARLNLDRRPRSHSSVVEFVSSPSGPEFDLLSGEVSNAPAGFEIDPADGDGAVSGTGDELTAEADDWFDDDPPCFGWRDDACDLLPMLGNDALSCVTWTNALILGVAAGGAIAIREHLDGDARDYTTNHRLLWGEGSEVLRQFGEFSWQVPAIGAVYVWSLWSQREHEHEFSKAVISAYTITALTTVVIKGITNTQRPTDQFQDGEYGFPSYHTASTFAIAAVADEYYGWPVGLPCYVLAGLVGFSRIDQREHDLSDVLFGSVLGFVIGKSISANHMDGCTGCQVVPYYDPATRCLGATFHRRF